jgi:hypothetical protein
MGSGDDVAVADEGSGAVVVICGDAKDAHCLTQTRLRPTAPSNSGGPRPKAGSLR